MSVVVRRGVGSLIVVLAGAVLAVACGDSDDETVRDENGNVIEGGAVSVFALNVGDCFVELPSGDVSTVDAVPCRDDHRFEMYHQFDIDLDDFDPATVQQAATEGCLAAFEGYAGVRYEQSYYDFDALQPSEGSWEQDDREVLCLITPRNGDTTRGTARNAGLLAENAGAGGDEQAATTSTTVAETAPADTAPAETAPEAVGGSQSVFELSVGECYVDLPGATEVETIEAISCDEPHGIEIYHLFDIDLPEFDADAVNQQAADGCLAAFEGYAGISYEESWYDFDGLLPTAGSWANGDREVVCFLFPFDENISTSVGSARGEGRSLTD